MRNIGGKDVGIWGQIQGKVGVFWNCGRCGDTSSPNGGIPTATGSGNGKAVVSTDGRAAGFGIAGGDDRAGGELKEDLSAGAEGDVLRMVFPVVAAKPAA